MHIERLWLENFRNYETADVSFAPNGLTLILGDNGHGKTNILEAVNYAATLQSFRRATPETMIRAGATSAIIRCDSERSGRRLLIEAELNSVGRNKAMANRQPLNRRLKNTESLLTTVFAPDDLEIVKGSPSDRRGYLDAVLIAGDNREAAIQNELERVLKQRNSLLRQAGGRLSSDIVSTLDVWDTRLAKAGEQLSVSRTNLIDALVPQVARAYEEISGRAVDIAVVLVSSWSKDDGLAGALVRSRKEDVQRGVSTVGPHRDEILLSIDGLAARTHGSQGEQRTFALALRLASHRYLESKHDVTPILLLDDVLSELDDERSERLMSQLGSSQTLLTSARSPLGQVPGATLRVERGKLVQ